MEHRKPLFPDFGERDGGDRLPEAKYWGCPKCVRLQHPMNSIQADIMSFYGHVIGFDSAYKKSAEASSDMEYAGAFIMRCPHCNCTFAYPVAMGTSHNECASV